MKITSVDIWTVVVPTIPGRVHSPEWVPETGWDQVPKHLVRLNTDTELVGLGETGRGLPVAQVREGAARLLGRDPECLTLQDIFAARHDGTEELPTVGAGPAYEAFEMAVFDLVGKAHAPCPYTRCWAARCASGCGPTIGWGTRRRKTASGRLSGHSRTGSKASRSSAKLKSRWSSGWRPCAQWAAWILR